MISPLEILKKYWGYDVFRPLQTDVIHSALNGDDALVLMPTGGGKSICYQVPGIILPGVCIVVSPLVALMEDQVQNLKRRGVKAEFIHSGLSLKDVDRILDNTVYGALDFLYIAPERIKSHLFITRFEQMPVGLLVVDEAHCISQWGMDFRPDYRNIASLRTLKPDMPVMALTASATPKVVADIQDNLHLKIEKPYVTSFGRDNLSYIVFKTDAKSHYLYTLLQRLAGTGIIYLPTRAAVDKLVIVLSRLGIKCLGYHAGMTFAKKSENMDLWLKGTVPLMIATNAFGMGVDKPDVRYVIHLGAPSSIEAYYQEAGRAGRDKDKARCIILFSDDDEKRMIENFDLKFPEISEIKRAYNAIASQNQIAIGAGEGVTVPVDLQQLSKQLDFNPRSFYYALKTLDKYGYVKFSDSSYGGHSHLKISISQEEFYGFRIREKKYDVFLTSLLRYYSTLFYESTSIDEFYLAKSLGWEVGYVKKLLTELHQKEIVVYDPAVVGTSVTFTKERLATDNLSIPFSDYKLRKDAEEEKLKAMLQYLETPSCKENFILHYFGEERKDKCGRCTSCLAQSADELSAIDRTTILKYLQTNGATTTEDLRRLFPLMMKDALTELLTVMADRRELKLEGNRVSL